MKALLCALMLMVARPIEAANHYVRDGGTCVSACTSSWATAGAYDQLSSAEANAVRGDTIYVADGAYGGVTFNTATSGTTTITVKKATIASHGTDTGWLDTYGDGQAVWTPPAGWSITTGYWVFDGVSGAGSTTSSGGDISTYGFRHSGGPDTQGIVDLSGTHIQIKHTAIQCAFTPDEANSEYGLTATSAATFAEFSYVFLDGCQVGMFWQATDLTVLYSYFGRQWSTSGASCCHGVMIEALNRMTLAYNFFLTCATQCIEPAGGCDEDMDGAQIYGNVITNLVPNANNANNPVTNGFIKGVCTGAITNALIYNNTLYNSQGPLIFESNFGGGTGNVLRNNICYLCTGGLSVDDGALTHSHNWMVDSGSVSETGAQTSSGNPFTSLVLGGFHLDGSPACNAGFTLSSPFTVDLYGGSLSATCAGGFARGAVGDGSVDTPGTSRFRLRIVGDAPAPDEQSRDEQEAGSWLRRWEQADVWVHRENIEPDDGGLRAHIAKQVERLPVRRRERIRGPRLHAAIGVIQQSVHIQRRVRLVGRLKAWHPPGDHERGDCIRINRGEHLFDDDAADRRHRGRAVKNLRDRSETANRYLWKLARRNEWDRRPSCQAVIETAVRHEIDVVARNDSDLVDVQLIQRDDRWNWNDLGRARRYRRQQDPHGQDRQSHGAPPL